MNGIERDAEKIENFLLYSSAIKNLEQTQGTWRQTPNAARHEAQLERFKAELKVRKKEIRLVAAAFNGFTPVMQMFQLVGTRGVKFGSF
jgi:hypothetical protein